MNKKIKNDNAIRDRIILEVFYMLDKISLILLIIFTVLPIVMFVTALITKYSIKAEFAVQNKTTPKNSSFPVQLCVTNKSIFPIGKAEAHIEYYNIFKELLHFIFCGCW